MKKSPETFSTKFSTRKTLIVIEFLLNELNKRLKNSDL